MATLLMARWRLGEARILPNLQSEPFTIRQPLGQDVNASSTPKAPEGTRAPRTSGSCSHHHRDWHNAMLIFSCQQYWRTDTGITDNIRWIPQYCKHEVDAINSLAVQSQDLNGRMHFVCIILLNVFSNLCIHEKKLTKSKTNHWKNTRYKKTTNK